ncbi:substrate-binding domain-containing protein [Nitrospira sp. NS4]|uniref:substrate-binding domain-containing protein n=1 Tax=Nitrospira sp. NS4 TaxID=3414498 RepID=UPI003C2E0D68
MEELMGCGWLRRNAGKQRGRRWVAGAPALWLLVILAGILLPVSEAVSGAIAIAGNGPELRVFERLTRAFEKKHLGVVAEIRWDSSFHPIAMVKSGEADLAVAGERDPDLDAVPIAWDGIAVVVDFTNPVKGLTAKQVAAMFSGRVTRWSDLGGTDNRIELIDRPSNQHIRGTFETVLGIVGKIPLSAQVRRSDQRAISSVAGNGAAVTYASLGVVLDAVMYGVGVSPLLIDGVEPANQTVKDGRYRLRRPVLLLRKPGANPIADSFAEFALSKEGQDIIEDMFAPYNDPGR